MKKQHCNNHKLLTQYFKRQKPIANKKITLKPIICIYKRLHKNIKGHS